MISTQHWKFLRGYLIKKLVNHPNIPPSSRPIVHKVHTSSNTGYVVFNIYAQARQIRFLSIFIDSVMRSRSNIQDNGKYTRITELKKILSTALIHIIWKRKFPNFVYFLPFEIYSSVSPLEEEFPTTKKLFMFTLWLRSSPWKYPVLLILLAGNLSIGPRNDLSSIKFYIPEPEEHQKRNNLTQRTIIILTFQKYK